MDVDDIISQLDRRLQEQGTPDRAQHERAYLKSSLVHYGVTVPALRSTAKAFAATCPTLSHDDLVAIVSGLWDLGVHEDRMVAVELLSCFDDRLGPCDAPLLEQLLRTAKTWALVDGLAANVVGPLVDHHRELGRVLDRWAVDDDFWIRRAALLALLVPLRRGDGDFERFGRYADAMLDDKEFFVRKAIGWVLRDTARKQPELVYGWILPRASRASGVTVREAVKPLTEGQAEAVLAAWRPGR